MTLVLNYALIRARAAQIGLAELAFRRLTGVRLADLEEVFDYHRDVSLALLARLAEVLDLSITDLLFDPGQTAPAPATADPDDAQLLLALLLRHGALAVDQLLDLLGWTPEQLDAAATAGAALLAGGPMRLAVTDQYLACLIRPGLLPDDVRDRFADSERLRAPLTGHEAHELLRLVHEHLLLPFGDQHGHGRVDVLTENAQRGLVTDVTLDPHHPLRATARPHPDVLFALRLVETPAAAGNSSG
jgi:hypothetical protein